MRKQLHHGMNNIQDSISKSALGDTQLELVRARWNLVISRRLLQKWADCLKHLDATVTEVITLRLAGLASLKDL